MKITNWGNYPAVEATVKSFSTTKDLQKVISEFQNSIPRGLGRCYGDSSLWEDIISSLRYDRILDFNREEGIMRCQAGVSLKDILDLSVPDGWFLPVTPGTKFVTLGGAIASDVHGKNHHKDGTFSEHLRTITVMLPDGSIVSCSKGENPDVFKAVCGGMGLTGIILDATLALRRIETAFINYRSVKAKDLDKIMDLFEASEDVTYSVAWIDCLSRGAALGRSILMTGEHATSEETKYLKIPENPLILKNVKKHAVPFNLPAFVLNPCTMKAFNAVYFNKGSEDRRALVDYDSFFYPLDRIHHWNKIYGARGFLQYQCVIPLHSAYEGLKRILGKIADRGIGSFLAILKLMGNENDNMISFPLRGYTLALDFPVTADLFTFLEELDRIVLDYGGRLYLAKDARMSGEMFRKSYPRAQEFIDFKYKLDPEGKLKSLQSKRLNI